jgi:hypothetical protein
VEYPGEPHEEYAKAVAYDIATSGPESLEAQLAQIERLESMLAIAKATVISQKAVQDRKTEEEQAAAAVEASRVAKRKRREEGAAGFAERDAILAEEAATENDNSAGSSSDAPPAPSDTEEVGRGRSKRQRRA